MVIVECVPNLVEKNTRLLVEKNHIFLSPKDQLYGFDEIKKLQEMRKCACTEIRKRYCGMREKY